MRDPNRIDIMLSKLREVWVKQPDTRLCQLIDNLTYKTKPIPFFYLEDDIMLNCIEDEIKKGFGND